MLLYFEHILLAFLSLFSNAPPPPVSSPREKVLPRSPVQDVMVTSFSWTDCGSGPVHLKALSVSPDPIIIPGLLSIGFNVTNDKNLQSPVSLTLVVKKKIAFVWVKIPCEEHLGSCTYNDVCSIVPPTCPESFIKYKIPCKCPVQSGTFYMPLSPVLNISGAGIPKWLESGQYEVRITMKDKSGTELVCVDVNAKLKAK